MDVCVGWRECKVTDRMDGWKGWVECPTALSLLASCVGAGGRVRVWIGRQNQTDSSKEATKSRGVEKGGGGESVGRSGNRWCA